MKSTKKRSSFSMQETDEAEEENEDLSDRQKQIREGGAVVTKNESTPSSASPSSDRLKGITSHRRRTKRRSTST